MRIYRYLTQLSFRSCLKACAIALFAFGIAIAPTSPSWGIFSTPSARAVSATISGVVYQTNEISALTGTAHPIKLRTSAGVTASSNLVSGTGAFSFAGVTLTDGDVVTIWLTGSVRASLVFKYGSGCTGYTDCTGLKLFQGRVSLASYDGTAITNGDLGSCDDDSNCVLASGENGDGRDGALSVASGTTTIDGTQTNITAVGSNYVDVASATGFDNGTNNDVLVIQMTGTGVGNYEELVISSVSGSRITFTGSLQKTYQATGAQIIRIPNYTTVTLSGGTLTAAAWNGTIGGVLIFRATGAVTMTGTAQISMAGKGFAGGSAGGGGGGETGKAVGSDGGYGTSQAINCKNQSNGGNVNFPAGGVGTSGTGGGAGGGGGLGGGVFWGAAPSGANCYGGKGGDGGTGGSAGSAGSAGGTGSGTGGGAGSAGGTNGSGANLATIIMGGGGGGSAGGSGGGAGGGGGGGGGCVTLPNVGSCATAGGSNGSTGSTGGAGNTGGIGGGIIIIKALSVTVGASALITASGTAGGAGGTGGAGGQGGAGKAGNCAGTTCPPNQGLTDGGGGGGGGGGKGGTGGQGGGGGAGGAIRIESDTVSLGTNRVTSLGGGAGGAGSGGGAGAFGTGGTTYNGCCQDLRAPAVGNNGSAGSAGASGAAGAAGSNGLIHVLADSDPTVSTNPAASHAGGYVGPNVNPPGFTSNNGPLALTTTTKIVVPSGSTYAPGGNVTAAQMEVLGTYTGGGETVTLSGSGTSNGCANDTAIALCTTGTMTSPGTTKFVFTGSGNMAPYYGSAGHAPTFYDLEIQGVFTGGATAATVTHNLNVIPGATFTAGTTTPLTMTDGSTITCDGTCALNGLTIDGAVSTTGNWSSTYGVRVNAGGALTAGDTVTIAGAGITTTTTGTATFNNMTVTGSTYGLCANGSDNITVTGVLTSNVDTSVCYTMNMTDGSTITGSGAFKVGVLNISGSVTATGPVIDYSSSGGNPGIVVGPGDTFTSTDTLTFQINGTITNTGGTVSLNNLAVTGTGYIAGDVSIAGTYSVNAGIPSTQTSGTVTMLNGSSISNSGTGLTFYNLKIPANATVTANTNFTVAASAGFEAGSTFTPSSGTVSLPNSSRIENSGGNVVFNNLTTVGSPTGAMSASGSFDVSGTLTVGTNTQFTPSATTIIGGAGTLTGGGVTDVTRSTGTNDFSGQYPISGKTISSLTVNYAGTAQGVDDTTYGTLQFSGTNATSVTATAKNLAVATGGSFTPSAGTITIQDTGLISQIGTGVLTANNITLANNASVSGTIAANGTLTVPTGGLLEPNATTTRIGGSGTITGGGSIYVSENLAATAAGGDLARQYPISNRDLANLRVIFTGSACTIRDYTFHDIRFQASCTDTGTLNFTVNGTLSLATGTTMATNANATITLAGATVVAEGNSTFTYTNISVTGNATIQGTGTFVTTLTKRIDIPAGASLTVTSPTTFLSTTAGSPDIVDNGTLTFGDVTNAAGAVTASVSGGFNVTGTFNNLKTTGDVYTGTMTLQNGATIYDRAAAGSTFPNITVADGASVTSSGSYPVSGTLSVGTGATLTPTATSVISGAGTLTGTGTVKVIRATGTNDFAGQYSISNKDISGLTVDFAGSGQDIDDLTYGNLKVSGSVTAATSPVIAAGGQLLVTGTLTPSAGSVSFAGDGTILNSGTLTFYNLDIPAGVSVGHEGGFGTANLFKDDGSFSPGATNVFSGAGTLAGSGTIGVARTTGSSTFTDQYTISNIDLSGGLTVKYSGNTTQAMTPMTYKNLTVTNANVTGVASVSGTFTSSATVGNSSTKIEMTGSGWSIAGTPTFNKLSIDTTPTTQPTGSFAIATNGTFAVESGATLAPTAGTLTLNPGVTFSGTGTLAPYSLTLTGSGTTTLPANLTVANALTIGNGHTLNLGTGTLTLTAQNPTVTNNGSISGAAGTIEYAPVGTGGTTIPATTFYGHLKLNKQSNVFTVSSGTLSVGELNIAAGTLDMGSNSVNARVASVSISGTLNAPTPSGSLTVTGEWNNNGTFNHGNGTVTFEPSGDSDVIQGSAETDFYNLRMNQPGKTLKVKAGTLFDVDGTLDISGLSGNPAFLESDTPGQTFTLALASPVTLNYVQLKDVACHASTATLTLGEHGDTRSNVGTCVVRIQRGGGGSAFAPAGENAGGGGAPTSGGTCEGGVCAGGVNNTGLKSPTSTGSVNNEFTNPTYAYSSNNQYAEGTNDNVNGGNVTNEQDYGTFGFGIPSNATINGITISLEHAALYGTCFFSQCPVEIRLSYDGGRHWTSAKTYYENSGGVDATDTLGSTSDVWGRTWAGSELSDANFRVLVTIPVQSLEIFTEGIDHLQANVRYTTSSSGGAAQDTPTPTPAPPTGGGGDEGGGGEAAP